MSEGVVPPQRSDDIFIPGASVRQRALVIDALRRSADLVQTWGQAQLPGGRTLSETLSAQGLSLWDAIAVEVARLYVATSQLPGTPAPWFSRRVHPHLQWVKHRFQEALRNRRGPQWRADWPAEPTLLMLGFGGYVYRDALKPVADRVKASGDLGVVSLHDGNYGRTAQTRGGASELRSIWEYYDAGAKARAANFRRELRAAVSRVRQSKALPELIRDGDQPLWPALKDTFDWLFRVYLPLLIPEVAIAFRILETYRPAVIISSDVADRHARVYTLLGRTMEIPVLEIQPAPCGLEGIEWRFFTADRIAAAGKSSREAMVAFGVPREIITVTGSPRYDTRTAMSDAEIARIRASLGVPPSRALVLFASAYSLARHEGYSDPALLGLMKRTVFQAAKEIDGCFLLVKPHPLEDPRETAALAEGCPNIVFADPRADIRPLVQACDAFVSLGTSATADALIARKLTICPCFPGFAWGEPYVTSGATLVPRSAREVEECLRLAVDGSRDRVLSDLAPARQRFLDQWVSLAGDVCAASRIEAVAREMAGLPQRIRV